MHRGSADLQFQIPASNEIFRHFVNSLAARAQLKVELSILFCQTQGGKRTERKATVGGAVIARQRSVAIKHFAIEPGTVRPLHHPSQALRKSPRTECLAS